MPDSLILILGLIAFAIELLIGAFVYFSESRQPARAVFALSRLLQGLLVFANYQFLQAAATEQGRLWLELTLLWPVIVAFMFHFTLLYARPGWPLLRNPRLPWLFYPLMILCSAFLISGIHGMEVTRGPWGFFWGEPRRYQVLAGLSQVAPAALAILSAVVMTWRALRTPAGWKKQQAKFLVLALATPMAGGILCDSPLAQALWGYKATLFMAPALTLQSLLIVYAITRYKLFKVTPASAADVILASIGDAVIATDSRGKIDFMNTAAEVLTGWTAAEARAAGIERVFLTLDAGTRAVASSPVDAVLRGGEIDALTEDRLLLKRDGREIPIDDSAAPIKAEDGTIHGAVLVFRDISERQQAAIRLQGMQDQLLQSEKLASLGQLSAGIAHEINNPAAYILANLSGLGDYVRNCFSAVEDYEDALRNRPPEGAEKAEDVIHRVREQRDLDAIQCDLPDLMAQTLEGVARIRRIVSDLKEFAHPRNEDFQPTDLSRELEKALTLVWNELKYRCQVTREFSEVPEIPANQNQVDQVFVNLLINAAQAIPEGRVGELTLKTYARDGWAFTAIADNGAGIARENLPKIFEPFFTTKPVGKGTGLGLSIVYSILQKHRAEIQVDSRVGEGTCFTIRWPLAAKSGASA